MIYTHKVCKFNANYVKKVISGESMAVPDLFPWGDTGRPAGIWLRIWNNEQKISDTEITYLKFLINTKPGQVYYLTPNSRRLLGIVND